VALLRREKASREDPENLAEEEGNFAKKKSGDPIYKTSYGLRKRNRLRKKKCSRKERRGTFADAMEISSCGNSLQKTSLPGAGFDENPPLSRRTRCLERDPSVETAKRKKKHFHLKKEEVRQVVTSESRKKK